MPRSMSDDFADDGASFRVRREGQVMEIFPPRRGAAAWRGVVIAGEAWPSTVRRLPLFIRLVLWLVIAAAAVFATILLGVLGLAVLDNLPGR